MRRMLGIDDDDGDTMSDDGTSWLDGLKGRTLNQMGVDMLQDGRPVWVVWDSFLESIAEDLGIDGLDDAAAASGLTDGDVTPTARRSDPTDQWKTNCKSHTTIHDSVVEVVITQANVAAGAISSGTIDPMKHNVIFAKMIITVWEIEEERYYTLTFTNTEGTSTSSSSSESGSRPVSRVVKHYSVSAGSAASNASPSSSTGSNRSSNHGSTRTSAITSPSGASMSSSPFPPLGPPAKVTMSSAPSSLQKIIMMKDALLDNTEVPIAAMWKDESIVIPNKAARRLFRHQDMSQVKDATDVVAAWDAWDETFTTKLEPHELPISVLIRTQTPFSSRKIGMLSPETGKRIVYDCLGEGIYDPESGEFLAGILTCRDITTFTQTINEIREKDEQRFQLICDSMPQLLWTTTPDGMHDWFSQRW